MDFEKEKILKNVEGNITLWRHGIITPSAALDLIYKSIHEPRGDYGDNIRYNTVNIEGNMSRLAKGEVKWR